MEFFVGRTVHGRGGLFYFSLICCDKDNNDGDGFVMEIIVVMVGVSEPNRKRARQMGV